MLSDARNFKHIISSILAVLKYCFVDLIINCVLFHTFSIHSVGLLLNCYELLPRLAAAGNVLFLVAFVFNFFVIKISGRRLGTTIDIKPSEQIDSDLRSTRKSPTWMINHE